MALIFSLVLEFFLLAEVNNVRDLKTEKAYMTAQMMYKLTRQKGASFIRFNKGTVTTTDKRIYYVRLTDEKTFTFGD